MLPGALLALLSVALAAPISPAGPAATVATTNAIELPWTPLPGSFMLPDLSIVKLASQQDGLALSLATPVKVKVLAYRTKVPPTTSSNKRTKTPPTAAPTTAARTTMTTTTRATTTSSSPSSTTAASLPLATTWNQKTNFFSLASFIQNLAVPRFTFGQSNVEVVQGIPQSAWAPGVSSSSNNASALRIAYPAGSFSPGNTPQGGVGFYSQPVDLSSANNVSLAYSVFFPRDFDFVKGGKLPGLYGGRSGCSGGQGAEDCFSTRLMFRTNGAGELYLYAPREKQVGALCTLPPLSYCNSVDGMSIGRGSFSFARGQWTNIRQDIWLNTPGIANGGFNIWVNDKLVLHSDSVYYRNPVGATKVGVGSADPSFPLIDYDNLPAGTVIPNGGFINATQIQGYKPVKVQVNSTDSATGLPVDWENKKRRLIDLNDAKINKRQTVSTPIGFVGLMYHTFFGGSTIAWASPRLQYSYINQVGIRIRG